MGIVIGFAVAIALLWAFFTYRSRQADRELDLAFTSAIMEARRNLSDDDVASLRRQVRELEAAGNAQVATGALSRKDADRMTKRACIQSAYAAIEISRMFGPQIDEPSATIPAA